MSSAFLFYLSQKLKSPAWVAGVDRSKSKSGGNEACLKTCAGNGAQVSLHLFPSWLVSMPKTVQVSDGEIGVGLIDHDGHHFAH